MTQAREAYRQAQAQFDLVRHGNRREDIEGARQEMQAAEESLRLVLRGSRSEDIRAARARVDQEQAALNQLERGSRPEDIAKAKAANEQAVAQTRSVAQNLNEHVIYASRDSTVERVLIADGDLISANEPIIQLNDAADIWLRVYLPEEQLPKVKVGDSADLIFDGISGRMAGLVESIASKGEFTPANLQSPDERGKQVFAVRIRLAHPDPRVRAGMYATVKKVGLWP